MFPWGSPLKFSLGTPWNLLVWMSSWMISRGSLLRYWRCIQQRDASLPATCNTKTKVVFDFFSEHWNINLKGTYNSTLTLDATWGGSSGTWQSTPGRCSLSWTMESDTPDSSPLPVPIYNRCITGKRPSSQRTRRMLEVSSLASAMSTSGGQCCHKVSEYLNSWDQIVVFDIRWIINFRIVFDYLVFDHFQKPNLYLVSKISKKPNI